MKHIKGDLVALAQDDVFDVIVHGCNCFHTMGAGIALQIAQTFRGPTGPEAVDRNCTKKGDLDKLGSFTIGEGLSNTGKPIAIINAYTQYGIGPRKDGSPPVDYDAVREVFRGLAKLCTSNGTPPVKIGYPAIGTGLAMGDWNIVSAIIDEELRGLDHTYVEYVPVAKEKTEAQKIAAILRDGITSDIFIDPEFWNSCESDKDEFNQVEDQITEVIGAMEAAAKILEEK